MKIYYNKDGWVCNRYPYDLEIDNENNFLDISDEDYNLTLSCKEFHAWKVINNLLVVERYEETPINTNFQIELDEIKNWFFENDWKINKIITGEWNETDPRWVQYLEERSNKRNRQDEIELILNK